MLNAEGYTGTDLQPLMLPLFDAYGGGRHGLLLLGKGALYPLSRGQEDGTGRSVWHSTNSGLWPLGGLEGEANLEAEWWPVEPDSRTFQSDAPSVGIFVAFVATGTIRAGDRLIYDNEEWPPDYEINYKDL